jgi:hypothetical protein
MPKPILTTEAQGNASPFREKGKDRDPTRKAVSAVATVAFLTFLGSMVAVLLMHTPKPQIHFGF